MCVAASYTAQNLTPARSGTADRPISYVAYPGEDVVLTREQTNGLLWYQVEPREYIHIEGFVFDGQGRVHQGLRFEHAKNITIKDSVIKNFTEIDTDTAEPISGTGLFLNGGNEEFLVEGTAIFRNGPPNKPLSENGGNIQIRRGGGTLPANRRITFRDVDSYESYTEDGLQAGDDGPVYDLVIENSRFWDNKEDGVDIKQVVGARIQNSEFWGHHATPTGGGAGVKVHIGAKDVLVDLSIAHDNDVGLGAGGVREPIENIVFSRNSLYGNDQAVRVARYPFPADVIPPGLTDFRAYNNTIVDNNVGLFFYWWPDGTVDIRNNIFANRQGADRYDWRHLDDGVPDGSETIDYNAYPEDGVILFRGQRYTPDSLSERTSHEANSTTAPVGFARTTRFRMGHLARKPAR